MPGGRLAGDVPALETLAARTLRPDADIAAAGSRGRILILRTREDLHIAREALRLAGTPGTD